MTAEHHCGEVRHDVVKLALALERWRGGAFRTGIACCLPRFQISDPKTMNAHAHTIPCCCQRSSDL